MLLWRTRHDSPRVFYVFTERGPSFLPFYYFPKAKEPCASQMMMVTVKRRMVMKSSGSLTEPLLDSLVSFVFVVTYNGPKQLTNFCMPMHLTLHALCARIFKGNMANIFQKFCVPFNYCPVVLSS